MFFVVTESRNEGPKEKIFGSKQGKEFFENTVYFLKQWDGSNNIDNMNEFGCFQSVFRMKKEKNDLELFCIAQEICRSSKKYKSFFLTLNHLSVRSMHKKYGISFSSQ